MKIFGVLFFALLIMLNSNCNKHNCDLPGGYYDFVVHAQLSPQKDTFLIGDTITVTSIFNDTLYEKITAKDYNLKDFLFYPESFITKIDTIGDLEDFNEFEVVLDSKYNFTLYNYSSGDVSLIGQYNYSNNEYSLEYKFIAKRKGIYFFRHVCSLLDQGSAENQDFVGKCSKTGVDCSVNLNNSSDNNLQFLEVSPDPEFETVLARPERQFHKFGGYCFYVK